MKRCYLPYHTRNIKLLISVIAIGLVAVSCANGGNGTYSAEPVKSTATEKQHNGPESAAPAATSGGEGRFSEKRPSGEAPAAAGELRFDFAQRVDLAHLRSSGLLLDFGTEFRNKYTIGDWKTGWRGNYRMDGTTFTYAESSTARVYFFLNESEAGNGRLIFRAKGIDQKSKVRVYLNGEGLGEIEFGPSFSHVAVEVKDLLKAGDNELMLRVWGGAKGVDGKHATLAVDYVRVIPEGTDESQAASAVTSVIADSGGGVSKALRLRKGDRLTWYVPVPENAFLFTEMRSVGEQKDAKIVIDISKSGMAQTKLIHASVDAKGQTASASLADCGNDVCAVDVRVLQGEALIETLQMREQVGEREKAPGRQTAQNVVLVLIDTLRADHLAMYNQETRVRTPFLDALARESMVFENAWAQENWTKPSITSLLTGLYSAAHQNKSEKNKVPSTALMIQEYYSKLGFETAGLVANGYVSDKFGFKRGWDTWTNYVREGKRNRAQFVADDAVNWLKARKSDKSFFLYVHTIDPHVPYIPPAQYRAMYDNEPYNGVVQSTQTATLLEKVKTGAVRLSDRDKFRLEALYDGEISYHDDHLIKIYDELKAQGLLENTVIIVTADHGEEFFEHGSVGHGHSLYEELLHVPLIVRLPGATEKTERGVRFKEMVELVDVFPTVCALTGVETPAEVQGKSLIPQLNGMVPQWPSVAFSEFMGGQLTARTTRYKLIYRGLRTTLFDLEKDPRETADLSNERPEAFVMMRDALGLHMGQFAPTGAVSPSDKSNAKQKSETQGIKPAAVHKRENATIDAETRKQLEALGYMGD